ncbi:MAG: hypothetical protein R3296_03685 [Oleiphilaceae bacterium]|nr:hypothetical protein [Oleiphilaceae bacterium]
MARNDQQDAPGTVSAARMRKAACGLRYEEGQLRAGIDFSAASQLLEPSGSGQEATPERETDVPGEGRL